MMKISIKLALALTLLSVVSQVLDAATGEVTKSGSIWTAKVDGSTKYTGTDMINAINACTGNMSSGTINVRNSGTAVAPKGLRSVNINSNQTIDFHGTTMTCENPLNIYPVKGYKKSNVAVKNVNIMGVPRYILHFSGCTGITLSNITAHTTRGSGIRIEDGSNLTMNGNINLYSPGHCIETMRFNDIYIGKVTVESPNGCGVLFNTSENCNIDEIWAYNCNPGGSYAGFRQANSNGTTHCNFLRAKNCGRGLYVITSSHHTTIENVDIDDCNQSGVSVTGTAHSVRINSGTISNTPKAIDLWDGCSNVCIKVNGERYGDACSRSPGLINRNSGLCLSSNNSNISQYSCNNSEPAQHFELKNVGSGYYLIKNLKNGQCLRSSGSTIYQHACYDYYWSEMFSRQDVGNGYYLLRNRNTNTCLRIGDNSGDNVYLHHCHSDYWSEMFSFYSISYFYSFEISEDLTLTETQTIEATEDLNDLFDIFPTSIEGNIYVHFKGQFDAEATAYVYDAMGKLVHTERLHRVNNALNLKKLSSGIYTMTITSKSAVRTIKFDKK